MADARAGTTYKDSFNANQGNLAASGKVNGGISDVVVSGEGNTGTGTAAPVDSSSKTSNESGPILGGISK